MQDLMQSSTYREAVETGKIEGKIEGEIKGLIKYLGWISPELAEKYKSEVKTVKTEQELAKIEERIKKEIDAK